MKSVEEFLATLSDEQQEALMFHLDEEVRTAKDDEASAINADGIEAQAAYLELNAKDLEALQIKLESGDE